MVSTVGIKLANGKFYSILEENSNAARRLILTTVHDTQQSMRIDLYKSFTRSMTDARYLGSIVVDNIKKKLKGGPSIELVITSNANGKFTAAAADLDDPANRTKRLRLSASLKSLEEDTGEPEISGFDLRFHAPAGLYDDSIRGNRGRREFHRRVFLIAGAAVIILGFCLWFFVFFNDGQSAGETIAAAQQYPARQGSEPPSGPKTASFEPLVSEGPDGPQTSSFEPLASGGTDVPQTAAVEPLASEGTDGIRGTAAPVIEAPAAPPSANTASKDPEAAPGRGKRSPPVASYKIPATIPREGHPYRVRWGDTLWDISEAFYRNPWLYLRIARSNGIRNPDLIVSGKIIRIPSKN
ncbi:MAG: LysM peptidoglycan-binding domain-containing protein [Spirochaetaceae bacterium]|jgi:hypothetical protein|nr:LysM peptidoglycan-binding domain-containing protein [Spirochaetaceae bacterium]